MVNGASLDIPLTCFCHVPWPFLPPPPPSFHALDLFCSWCPSRLSTDGAFFGVSRCPLGFGPSPLSSPSAPCPIPVSIITPPQVGLSPALVTFPAPLPGPKISSVTPHCLSITRHPHCILSPQSAFCTFLPTDYIFVSFICLTACICIIVMLTIMAMLAKDVHCAAHQSPTGASSSINADYFAAYHHPEVRC